jgi:hypothetical protein
MAQAATSTRAPRGTKILAKAFFTAAEEFPEAQRAEVIKAALVAIRDELKVAREKAAAAKAKAKGKKVTAVAPKKKIGRPVGSKNKSVKAAPIVAKKAAPKSVKKAAMKSTRKAAPKTKATKAVPASAEAVTQMAAD